MRRRETALCKVCGAPARFVCTTPNDRGRVRTLDHFRCPACGLVFVDAPLTTEDLAEAYAGLEHAAYYREIGEQNRKKHRAAAAAVASLAPGLHARILDIGCGNGDFLAELVSAGYRDVAGHEIPGAEAAVPDGAALYRDFHYESVPSGAFDVVTLLDVAEHVQDPRHLFRQCHRILRPGGAVYFHTPVVTALDRGMRFLSGPLGRAWQRSRTSVFHLQNYTRTSLELVLREAGFRDISIAVKNELSWPVSRYVRVYFCERTGLPAALSVLLGMLLSPFLASNAINPNKAVGWARRPG